MNKCSFDEHKEENAVSYCQECNISLCRKCEKIHQGFFKNHHNYDINKDISEIFTGLCKEKNHSIELKYFCKTHNILCCSDCITKIKTNEIGQHNDCEIFLLKDIENIKKEKLNENIKCLENLSINYDKSINELKILVEKIDKKKEEIKSTIQNTFTKLRNIINEREDELLAETDKKFEELYFNEDLIRKLDKLPNKIKKSLEKGKLIDANWKKDYKLNALINDCLNIENNIKELKIIDDILKKKNILNIDLKFIYGENEVNHIFEEIKKLGNVSNKIFNDTKIDFDENLIKLWLNNKNFKTELLFRKTRDGDTPKDFHNKCDNKGITIIFIETSKGYKFGGYTELQWDTSNKGKTDKSTFLFSFNNKEKYTSRKNRETIGCSSSVGPYFGWNWPEIYLKNTLNKGQSWNYTENTFVLDRKLTGGEEYWDVKELEVFKITYI